MTEELDSEMILDSLPLWVGEKLWVHFKNLESMRMDCFDFANAKSSL